MIKFYKFSSAEEKYMEFIMSSQNIFHISLKILQQKRQYKLFTRTLTCYTIAIV
jgi:hypothetical protein